MTDPNPEPTVALLDMDERDAYADEIADGLLDAWSDEDWQAWEDDGRFDNDPNPYHGDLIDF